MIQNDAEKQCTFVKLEMPPPKRGFHTWAKHSRMYTDVHRFISSREWVPIKAESTTAGTTWIELFALYDTSGHRSNRVEHGTSKTRKRKKEPGEEGR